MRNEQKTQYDAPFVAFYDMHAVMFVPPDEMADVSIKGLQWFILVPRLNHTGSHRPNESHSITYLHRKKIKDLEQDLPSLLQSYELRGKLPFVSDFCRLLRHAIEKGRGLKSTNLLTELWGSATNGQAKNYMPQSVRKIKLRYNGQDFFNKQKT